MPLYSMKKYIQLITMKSEPLHVLPNPIGGLIFLSTWRHETSKKLLNGDGSFLKGKTEGENALKFFWGSRWKELQFYFLIIGKKFVRCVTSSQEFWETYIPGDTVKACKKKKIPWGGGILFCLIWTEEESTRSLHSVHSVQTSCP